MKSIDAHKFMEMSANGVMIDVRTPAEYAQGHIPGAHNLPLFTNEERVIVGTAYKQLGRQPAILKGLEIIGPRMKQLVRSVESIAGSSNSLFLYCWRGGMRSGSMAWLLDLYGFQVFVLKKGYKAFRNFALATFNQQKDIMVLGGKTGSGKTVVLHELAALGEQVIDLEGLAHHKGSAFGTIGESGQPTQEHFENKLAMHWLQTDAARLVWLEDESRSIGKKIIPGAVWDQMRAAPVLNLSIPFDARLSYIVENYGSAPPEELQASVEKVKKRLGGLAYGQVTAFIAEGKLRDAAAILLAYYDKGYQHGLEDRDPSRVYPFETIETDFKTIARDLASAVKLRSF